MVALDDSRSVGLDRTWWSGPWDRFYTGGLDFAMSRVPDVAGKDVVDLGCGDGNLSVFLARKGANVLGLDKSTSALDRARARSRAAGVGDRCRFICAPAEAMPLLSGSADIVLSKSTLQYMDRPRVLAQCLRVLKPGGYLVLIENLPHNPVVLVARAVRRARAELTGNTAYTRSIRGYFGNADLAWVQSRLIAIEHRQYHVLGPLLLANCSLHRHGGWLEAALTAIDSAMLRRLPALNRLR